MHTGGGDPLDFLTTPSTPLKIIWPKPQGPPPLDFQLLCIYVECWNLLKILKSTKNIYDIRTWLEFRTFLMLATRFSRRMMSAIGRKALFFSTLEISCWIMLAALIWVCCALVVTRNLVLRKTYKINMMKFHHISRYTCANWLDSQMCKFVITILPRKRLWLDSINTINLKLDQLYGSQNFFYSWLTMTSIDLFNIWHYIKHLISHLVSTNSVI